LIDVHVPGPANTVTQFLEILHLKYHIIGNKTLFSKLCVNVNQLKKNKEIRSKNARS
jgi:hypothetical protein